MDRAELLGPLAGQDETVDGPVTSPTQVACDYPVNQRGFVVDGVCGTTQEAVTLIVLVEARIHTQRPTTLNRQLVIHFVSAQRTGVSKWFTVVEGQLTAQEEVPVRRNHFIADRGIEVTELHGQILVGHLAVQLRKSPFKSTVIPTVEIVVMSRIDVTERLTFVSVETEHHVRAETPIQPLAAVSDLAGEQVGLVQAKSPVFPLVHKRSVTSKCTVGLVLVAVLNKPTENPTLVFEVVSTTVIVEQAHRGPRCAQFTTEQAATEQTATASTTTAAGASATVEQGVGIADRGGWSTRSRSAAAGIHVLETLGSVFIHLVATATALDHGATGSRSAEPRFLCMQGTRDE